MQKWLQEGHRFIGEVEGVGNVSPQIDSVRAVRVGHMYNITKVKSETNCQGFPRVCHVVSCPVVVVSSYEFVARSLYKALRAPQDFQLCR